jgi:hypothetical protein
MMASGSDRLIWMVSRRWLINLLSRRSVVPRIQIVRLPVSMPSWIVYSLRRGLWRLGHLIEALASIRKLGDEGHAHAIGR